MSVWEFSTAGRILFGPEAVKEVGPAISRFGASRRTLIVTDTHLVAAGIVDDVVASLDAAGHAVEIFDGGKPEPSIDLARKTHEVAVETKPDVIIGVGGGSNMDLAKMTAVLVTHGGRPEDYFGFDNVPGPLLPLVCMPTTAGTGSEVSHSSVLTDTDNQMKVSTLSPYLRPSIAIVDPYLTLSCPQQASADSGIDALTHAIEAFTATDHQSLGRQVGTPMPYTGKHPMGDALAEQAIRLIGSHLITAVQEPRNLEARSAMSLAAMWAGMAFSNSGVALVHAMEYPVGGAVHCSHGAGNGLLLPYVMRHILPARTRELAQIAVSLGVDTIGMTPDEAAEAAIHEIERLRHAVGIPHQLRELGVQQDQLSDFANKAAGIERLIRLTPRPTTAEDILRIYQTAW